MCGMRSRCSDEPRATRLRKACDVCRRPEVALYAIEMLEGMHRVLFYMLEAVEGELCLLTALDVLEVTRYVLFCMPEGLEVLRGDAPCAALYAAGGRGGELCLLTALEVPEVTRCVLLCMLEVLE